MLWAIKRDPPTRQARDPGAAKLVDRGGSDGGRGAAGVFTPGRVDRSESGRRLSRAGARAELSRAGHQSTRGVRRGRPRATHHGHGSVRWPRRQTGGPIRSGAGRSDLVVADTQPDATRPVSAAQRAGPFAPRSCSASVGDGTQIVTRPRCRPRNVNAADRASAPRSSSGVQPGRRRSVAHRHPIPQALPVTVCGEIDRRGAR